MSPRSTSRNHVTAFRGCFPGATSTDVVARNLRSAVDCVRRCRSQRDEHSKGGAARASSRFSLGIEHGLKIFVDVIAEQPQQLAHARQLAPQCSMMIAVLE